MKKSTWVSVLASSIIIAAFGFGFTQIFAEKEKNPLSTQEAMGVISDRYPGEVQQVELEYEQGKMVYVGVLDNDFGKYEIKLDAKSGMILEVTTLEKYSNLTLEDEQKHSVKTEEEVKTSSKPTVNYYIEEVEEDSNNSHSTISNTQSEETNKNNGETRETNNTNKKSNTQETKNTNAYIGIEAAKRIALDKIAGQVKEIELENEDGLVYYEIEMITSRGEAEIEINAYTGEVIAFSIDNKGRTDLGVKVDASNVIGVVAAKKIANDHVSGTLKEIELDNDNGRLYYEVEMMTAKGEVEIKIDARTGQILSVEYDD